MRFEDLECLVRQWASDRGIYDPPSEGNELPVFAQYKKLFEEFLELGKALVLEDHDEIEDAIGDMMVVLTNIAFMNTNTLSHCFHVAYEQIKDRKGKMVNGIFVKEECESKIADDRLYTCPTCQVRVLRGCMCHTCFGR